MNQEEKCAWEIIGTIKNGMVILNYFISTSCDRTFPIAPDVLDEDVRFCLHCGKQVKESD